MRRRCCLVAVLAVLLATCIGPVQAGAAEIRRSADPAAVRNDAKLLESYVKNIGRTMQIIEKDKTLINAARSRDFDLAEKNALYTLWANYLDHILALDAFMKRYSGFYELRDRRQHAEAFLLAYAASLAKFSNGLRFIRLTMGNDLYEKKLDDRNPEHDIPEGMYAKLKWNTLHLKDVSGILAGYQYYRYLGASFTRTGLRRDAAFGWIFGYIDRQYAGVLGELSVKAPKYFAENGLDIVREKTFAAWFPLQLNVSEWMGDTKVLRTDRVLITEGQLLQMQRHLRPGDIIVERRNWYLSNIGLPGFWPHAELYIGALEDLRSFFDDPAVTAHYRAKGGYRDFADYLARTYPDKMKEYLGTAPDGHEHRIIEAVSEGVKFSSLQEGALADYIGVLRPRLSKLDIAKALEEAFHYVGRPYDFNFDFLTDSSIVCSELIYKVYRKGMDKKGLGLGLRTIAGRQAMPANDLVVKFDREAGTDGQELDFVYFLDGNEKEGRADSRGQNEFRATHRRIKWDIAQQ